MEPVQNEAEGETTIDVEWEGINFQIPVVDELDIDALSAFETGRSATAAKGVLGDTTYLRVRREFEKNHGRTPKVKDLRGLMDVIAVAYGFKSLGE